MRMQIVSLLILVSVSLAVQAEELRIPAMIGQTGASATFGKGELDAYTLAIEEWNAGGRSQRQKNRSRR